MRTNELSLYKLLAIFLQVVEQRSFTKAANKLGSSRSRVSQSISELEKHLGLRLLQRSTRQLALTPEGRDVYEQSIQLRGILNRVLALSELKTLEGRISITCPLDIAINRLRPVISAFEQLWPQIQFDIIASDSRIDIIENEIDLSIRIGPHRDESLVGRLLHQEQMKLYASPRYLEQVGEPNCIDDLGAMRWVLIEQLNSKPVINLNNADESRQLLISDHHMCNSPLVAQNLVEHGVGISLFLPTTVSEQFNKGTMVPVLPEWNGPLLEFSLMYPSRKYIPLRCRKFIDFLVEYKIFQRQHIQ